MIHENKCAFCRRFFSTNAVATRYCPRCARLRRALGTLDALRARTARPRRRLSNLWYDLGHPFVVVQDWRKARAS